jgi:hypothetical protein
MRALLRMRAASHCLTTHGLADGAAPSAAGELSINRAGSRA